MAAIVPPMIQSWGISRFNGRISMLGERVERAGAALARAAAAVERSDAAIMPAAAGSFDAAMRFVLAATAASALALLLVTVS
jgi:hypothetical protein